MPRIVPYVRFWHKADMLNPLTNVRFWEQTRHLTDRCLPICSHSRTTLGQNIQLIEITDAKNVAATTITVDGQAIRVVHTRHMAMYDGGIVSVYSGPCRMR
jgi:hypothetical protein